MAKDTKTTIGIDLVRKIIREELESAQVEQVTEDATPRTEEEAKKDRPDPGADNVELSKAAHKLKDTLSKATEGMHGHLAAALEAQGFDFKKLHSVLDHINSHPGHYTKTRPVADEVVAQDRRSPPKGKDGPMQSGMREHLRKLQADRKNK